MKLSISNIGWNAEMDTEVYKLMAQNGFTGLEIAPTRIFPTNPYDRIEEAKEWARELKEKYGFLVPSMQSIWYGRQEKIFGTSEERKTLLEYTKKAINFAEAINCKNLVFGCPRNRNFPENGNVDIAIVFFRELGEYAADHNTVIGMEANPPIYNTNYINDTVAALQLIKSVDSMGFKLNLDVGTMIHNGELVEELKGEVAYINHVHISEPGLNLIVERDIHKLLKIVLEDEEYQGFVSIEMGKRDNITEIENALKYIKNTFVCL